MMTSAEAVAAPEITECVHLFVAGSADGEIPSACLDVMVTSVGAWIADDVEAVGEGFRRVTQCWDPLAVALDLKRAPDAPVQVGWMRDVVHAPMGSAFDTWHRPTTQCHKLGESR